MRVLNTNGFALVAVLWIMVVVGAVGIAFQADAGAERRVVSNMESSVRTRWAARAGLNRTLSLLDSTSLRGRAAGSRGTVVGPLDLEVDGTLVRARATDARARVNLNRADRGSLRALFVSVGLDPARADGVAAAALDWRDADDSRRPGGAEARDYYPGKRELLPRNAPFADVTELQSVRGVTPEVYEAVARHVTTVGDGWINVNAASITALTTLPGVDRDAARLIATRRTSWPFRNVFELTSALPRDAREAIDADLGRFTDRIAFGPRTLEIVVEAAGGDSPVRSTLWAHVELTGGAGWQVRRLVER